MSKSTEKGKNAGVSNGLRSVTFKNVLITAIGVLTLSGCSALNVGNEDYACQGMPNGVQCMSARDVYAATNDGKVPRPTNADGDLEAVDDAELNATAEQLESDRTTSSGDRLIDMYVAPRLPNKPVPIRTPAEVMRIWVAPWEDTNGDLIVTGYIYTEIEARRWVVGDSMSMNDNKANFQPLQSNR
jgi:conjugal transfer pilus assembly protein TraV